LLERSIGRGTFVKGNSPNAVTSSAPAQADRWLIICDERQTSSTLVQRMLREHPGTSIVHDTSTLRPSFLSSIRAVIDFAPHTPSSFLRQLVVRNTAVVLVGREPSTYSMNAVLVDRTLGATHLSRELMLAGHRRFLAVEGQGSTIVSEAIRKAAMRYAPDATVDVAFADEATGAFAQGITAIICDGVECAADVRDTLRDARIDVPGHVSLSAVGYGDGDYPCTGYVVHTDQKVQAILQVIREGHAHRPTVLWLAGSRFDAGTTGPIELIRPSSEAAEICYDARLR
jgi:hypothetical protein